MGSSAENPETEAQRRSRTMRAVRSRDTTPELQVRRALHASGRRFRLHRADLPGRPDIVLPGLRTVIFVHGCFWHRHPGCPRARMPASRQDYWRPKLARNVERDARAQKQLGELGWRAVVIWECEARDRARLAAIIEGLSAAAPG